MRGQLTISRTDWHKLSSKIQYWIQIVGREIPQGFGSEFTVIEMDKRNLESIERMMQKEKTEAK